MLQAQIFIDKDKHIGGSTLHEFIMHLLMEHGIAGATSFIGYSGYGKHRVLKQPGRHFSFDETPMLITFSDAEEKVKTVLNELRKLYRGGFITTHSVTKW